MPIIRRQLLSDVAEVPKRIALDSRLSFGARGILSALLVPNEMYMEPTALIDSGLATSHEVKSALDELRQAGYIEYSKHFHSWRLVESIETPNQVVNVMLEHIREAEKYLSDLDISNLGSGTPEDIVDHYRYRYAVAQGKQLDQHQEGSHDAN
ncbi:hypothetical protein [Lacticaseibacillus daqingensis]|uniref:hypothetical protein n=1 Tax=Lacticaseibacillus daqingensis TaxID=2486014 RepID=UPI000F77C337|nr:hypothetical protein [Lacticaseibacillus daqingensis]